MQTSNPFLRDSKVREVSRGAALDAADRMTVNGTTTKVSILLAIVALSATLTWRQVAAGAGLSWMIGGGLVGFVLSLVISFKPRLAPALAVPFAIAEGLLLGGLSATYQIAAYPAIVLHAVMLTIAVSLSMFLLWRSGLIKVTQRMRSIVVGAMCAIVLVYIATFVLGMFSVQIPMIHDSGAVGIGFSVLVIVVCAFMLMIDFDMIQRLAHAGAPKSMEWYGAFALLVTLVWLYLELLRLLSKLNRR